MFGSLSLETTVSWLIFLFLAGIIVDICLAISIAVDMILKYKLGKMLNDHRSKSSGNVSEMVNEEEVEAARRLNVAPSLSRRKKQFPYDFDGAGSDISLSELDKLSTKGL